MAQHDFAPAWLNFPAPSPSSKISLNSEKHTESLVRPDSHYGVTRRRHNSSEAFDSAVGRTNGNFGRKENGWRMQGRNGSENVTQGSTFNGTGSRSRGTALSGGKSRESSSLENDSPRKDEREKRKQFEAEDFPSLNPEHDKEVNQNKSVSTGVWEYPLNSKSRNSRMLVIRKGMKDDFSLSGYPITTSTHIPPLTNGTDVSKGLFSKESSSVKEHSNALLDENKIVISSCETFRPNKALHPDLIDASQPLVKEEVDPSIFSNGKGTCHEQDINFNFEQSEIPQENRNSFPSGQITRSSTFPDEVVLSSSLEAEHRLLKEMGWQEDSENDTFAPLTEDEMREFQAISEQLQKNGLRKNGILKNGLSIEFKFDPWKHNSTFTDENEDTETSSSDTSDDDDL